MPRVDPTGCAPRAACGLLLHFQVELSRAARRPNRGPRRERRRERRLPPTLECGIRRNVALPSCTEACRDEPIEPVLERASGTRPASERAISRAVALSRWGRRIDDCLELSSDTRRAICWAPFLRMIAIMQLWRVTQEFKLIAQLLLYNSLIYRLRRNYDLLCQRLRSFWSRIPPISKSCASTGERYLSFDIFWRENGWFWRPIAEGFPAVGEGVGPFTTSTQAYANAAKTLRE